MIGRSVCYRVAPEHETSSIKGKDDKGQDIEVHGSVHHESEREFAGQVTRVHRDGSHDLVIFPPDKAPRHVHKVKEGDGPGTLSFVAADDPAQNSSASKNAAKH